MCVKTMWLRKLGFRGSITAPFSPLASTALTLPNGSQINGVVHTAAMHKPDTHTKTRARITHSPIALSRNTIAKYTIWELKSFIIVLFCFISHWPRSSSLSSGEITVNFMSALCALQGGEDILWFALNVSSPLDFLVDEISAPWEE